MPEPGQPGFNPQAAQQAALPPVEAQAPVMHFTDRLADVAKIAPSAPPHVAVGLASLPNHEEAAQTYHMVHTIANSQPTSVAQVNDYFGVKPPTSHNWNPLEFGLHFVEGVGKGLWGIVPGTLHWAESSAKSIGKDVTQAWHDPFGENFTGFFKQVGHDLWNDANAGFDLIPHIYRYTIEYAHKYGWGAALGHLTGSIIPALIPFAGEAITGARFAGLAAETADVGATTADAGATATEGASAEETAASAAKGAETGPSITTGASAEDLIKSGEEIQASRLAPLKEGLPEDMQRVIESMQKTLRFAGKVASPIIKPLRIMQRGLMSPTSVGAQMATGLSATGTQADRALWEKASNGATWVDPMMGRHATLGQSIFGLITGLGGGEPGQEWQGPQWLHDLTSPLQGLISGAIDFDTQLVAPDPFGAVGDVWKMAHSAEGAPGFMNRIFKGRGIETDEKVQDLFNRSKAFRKTCARIAKMNIKQIGETLKISGTTISPLLAKQLAEAKTADDVLAVFRNAAGSNDLMSATAPSLGFYTRFKMNYREVVDKFNKLDEMAQKEGRIPLTERQHHRIQMRHALLHMNAGRPFWLDSKALKGAVRTFEVNGDDPNAIKAIIRIFRQAGHNEQELNNIYHDLNEAALKGDPTLFKNVALKAYFDIMSTNLLVRCGEIEDPLWELYMNQGYITMQEQMQAISLGEDNTYTNWNIPGQPNKYDVMVDPRETGDYSNLHTAGENENQLNALRLMDPRDFKSFVRKFASIIEDPNPTLDFLNAKTNVQSFYSLRQACEQAIIHASDDIYNAKQFQEFLDTHAKRGVAVGEGRDANKDFVFENASKMFKDLRQEHGEVRAFSYMINYLQDTRDAIETRLEEARHLVASMAPGERSSVHRALIDELQTSSFGVETIISEMAMKLGRVPQWQEYFDKVVGFRGSAEDIRARGYKLADEKVAAFNKISYEDLVRHREAVATMTKKEKAELDYERRRFNNAMDKYRDDQSKGIKSDKPKLKVPLALQEKGYIFGIVDKKAAVPDYDVIARTASRTIAEGEHYVKARREFEAKFKQICGMVKSPSGWRTRSQIAIDSVNDVVNNVFFKTLALSSQAWAWHVGISEAVLNAFRKGIGIDFANRFAVSYRKSVMKYSAFNEGALGENWIRNHVGGMMMGIRAELVRFLMGTERGNRLLDNALDLALIFPNGIHPALSAAIGGTDALVDMHRAGVDLGHMVLDNAYLANKFKTYTHNDPALAMMLRHYIGQFMHTEQHKFIAKQAKKYIEEAQTEFAEKRFPTSGLSGPVDKETIRTQEERREALFNELREIGDKQREIAEDPNLTDEEKQREHQRLEDAKHKILIDAGKEQRITENTWKIAQYYETARNEARRNSRTGNFFLESKLQELTDAEQRAIEFESNQISDYKWQEIRSKLEKDMVDWLHAQPKAWRDQFSASRRISMDAKEKNDLIPDVNHHITPIEDWARRSVRTNMATWLGVAAPDNFEKACYHPWILDQIINPDKLATIKEFADYRKAADKWGQFVGTGRESAFPSHIMGPELANATAMRKMGSKIQAVAEYGHKKFFGPFIDWISRDPNFLWEYHSEMELLRGRIIGNAIKQEELSNHIAMSVEELMSKMSEHQRETYDRAKEFFLAHPDHAVRMYVPPTEHETSIMHPFDYAQYLHMKRYPFATAKSEIPPLLDEEFKNPENWTHAVMEDSARINGKWDFRSIFPHMHEEDVAAANEYGQRYFEHANSYDASFAEQHDFLASQPAALQDFHYEHGRFNPMTVPEGMGDTHVRGVIDDVRNAVAGNHALLYAVDRRGHVTATIAFAYSDGTKIDKNFFSKEMPYADFKAKVDQAMEQNPSWVIDLVMGRLRNVPALREDAMQDYLDRGARDYPTNSNYIYNPQKGHTLEEFLDVVRRDIMDSEKTGVTPLIGGQNFNEASDAFRTVQNFFGALDKALLEDVKFFMPDALAGAERIRLGAYYHKTSAVSLYRFIGFRGTLEPTIFHEIWHSMSNHMSDGALKALNHELELARQEFLNQYEHLGIGQLLKADDYNWQDFYFRQDEVQDAYLSTSHGYTSMMADPDAALDEMMKHWASITNPDFPNEKDWVQFVGDQRGSGIIEGTHIQHRRPHYRLVNLDEFIAEQMTDRTLAAFIKEGLLPATYAQGMQDPIIKEVFNDLGRTLMTKSFTRNELAQHIRASLKLDAARKQYGRDITHEEIDAVIKKYFALDANAGPGFGGQMDKKASKSGAEVFVSGTERYRYRANSGNALSDLATSERFMSTKMHSSWEPTPSPAEYHMPDEMVEEFQKRYNAATTAEERREVIADKREAEKKGLQEAKTMVVKQNRRSAIAFGTENVPRGVDEEGRPLKDVDVRSWVDNEVAGMKTQVGQEFMRYFNDMVAKRAIQTAKVAYGEGPLSEIFSDFWRKNYSTGSVDNNPLEQSLRKDPGVYGIVTKPGQSNKKAWDRTVWVGRPKGSVPDGVIGARGELVLPFKFSKNYADMVPSPEMFDELEKETEKIKHNFKHWLLNSNESNAEKMRALLPQIKGKNIAMSDHDLHAQFTSSQRIQAEVLMEVANALEEAAPVGSTTRAAIASKWQLPTPVRKSARERLWNVLTSPTSNDEDVFAAPADRMLQQRRRLHMSGSNGFSQGFPFAHTHAHMPDVRVLSTNSRALTPGAVDALNYELARRAQIQGVNVESTENLPNTTGYYRTVGTNGTDYSVRSTVGTQAERQYDNHATWFKHTLTHDFSVDPRNPSASVYAAALRYNKERSHAMSEFGDLTGEQARLIATIRAAERMLGFVHNPLEKMALENSLRVAAPFYFAQNQSWRRAMRVFATDPGAFERYLKANLKMANFASEHDNNGISMVAMPGSQLMMMGLLKLMHGNNLPFEMTGDLSSMRTMLLGGFGSQDNGSLFRDLLPQLGPVATVPTKVAAGGMVALEDWMKLPKSWAKRTIGVENQILGPFSANKPFWVDLLPSTLVRNVLEGFLSYTNIHSAGTTLGSSYVSTRNQVMAELAQSMFDEISQRLLNQGGSGQSAEYWRLLKSDPNTAPRFFSEVMTQFATKFTDVHEMQVLMDRANNMTAAMWVIKTLGSFTSPLSISLEKTTYKFTEIMMKYVNKYGATEGYAKYAKDYPYHTLDTVFMSTSPSGDSYPETKPAYDFINQHQDFTNKYKSIAAYLIDRPKDAPLYHPAYSMEQQMGLRARAQLESMSNWNNLGIYETLAIDAGNSWYYNDLLWKVQVAQGVNPMNPSDPNVDQATIYKLEQATGVQWNCAPKSNAQATNALNNWEKDQISQYSRFRNGIWGKYHAYNQQQENAVNQLTAFHKLYADKNYVSIYETMNEQQQMILNNVKTLINSYNYIVQTHKQMQQAGQGTSQLDTDWYNYCINTALETPSLAPVINSLFKHLPMSGVNNDTPVA